MHLWPSWLRRQTQVLILYEGGGSNPPGCTIFISESGDWSSGMIPALGAGGRGFDSRIAPFLDVYPVFKNTGVIEPFTVGIFTEVVNDSMAQWQRVGFQSRRLRVRFPLGSFLFFFLFDSHK